MSNITFVGLDVHNESITAAILVPGSDEPQVLKLPADLMKVRQLFIRLSDKGPVRACYEASGAGFVLQRSLATGGFHCDVIAPSLIPRKAGDHRDFKIELKAAPPANTKLWAALYEDKDGDAKLDKAKDVAFWPGAKLPYENNFVIE